MSHAPHAAPPVAPPDPTQASELAPDTGTPADAESEHALYLRFLAKRDAEHARARQERREREDREHRERETGIARLLGRAADDGTGHCRWCRIVLGRDDDGNRTHPVVAECSGPTPSACELCGGVPLWDATSHRWVHACAGKRSLARPLVPDIERVRTPKANSAPGSATEPDEGFFGYRRGGVR